MVKLYVTTTGAGRQDGSSWANASTINNMSSLIEKAGPGGEVLLRADQGSYQVNSPITIVAGGQNGSPVSIRGVDAAGQDMNAAIVGNRAENWEPGKAQGSEIFRLLDGADNLHFENFAFKNVGNGAFRVGDNISNLSIADVTANNVTRFFENTVSGSASSATIDGLSIKNVDIDGYSLGAIRLRYNTNDVTIENVTADSQRQAGGQYIFGVMLDGTVHDVLIRNVEMKNSYGTSSPDKYWNGDGFTTELGVYGVRFEDTKASGNTDAGYDLKSSDTLLVNAYSEGNSRNYRFWSEGIKVQDSVSVNPETHGGSVGEAHVWLWDNVNVQFSGLKIVDDGSTKASMFELGSYATVIADKLPADYLSKSVIKNGSSIVIGQVAEGYANFNYQSSDTTYTWSPTTGQMSINGIAQAVPGANRVFQTVWDGGGNDTYDLSNYATDVSIDLRPGAWSIISQAQLARLHGIGSQLAPGNVANALLYQGDTRSLIENAVGGSKNDVLIGNDVGNLLRGENGNDRLFGEGGDDFIVGGKGFDHIDGGLGTDTTVVSGFSGGGQELFRFGDWVYALDGADRSHNIISNVELFNDGARSIALASVDVFNSLSYSASFNDLAQWLRGDAQGALNHYLYHGFTEGREAAYDAAQYLDNYADLRAAFGTNLELATSHFLSSGVDEHRLAENPLEYIASYDDLMDAFDFASLQQTIDQGLNHYQASGFVEGRRGGIDFDADQYMENFGDLAAAFNGDDTSAALHYINTGRHEHRLAEDPLVYLASSDDLLKAFGGPGTSIDELKNWGIRHFVASGWREGRPTDFDTDQYLSNYVDLRQAFSDGQGGYNEDAALLHYINYGFYEGRTDDWFV